MTGHGILWVSGLSFRKSNSQRTINEIFRTQKGQRLHYGCLTSSLPFPSIGSKSSYLKNIVQDNSIGQRETDVEIDTLHNGYGLSSSFDDENSFLGDDDIERGDFGNNDNINGDDGNQSDDDDKFGNDEENSGDYVYETKGDPKVAKCSGCRVSEEFPVDHSEEGSTSVQDHEVNDKTPLLNVVHIMSVVKKPNGKSGGIVAVWDTLWFSLNSSLEGDGFLALSAYVLGDFNEVRFSHERIGSLFDGRGASAFNNFIPVTGLLDLPLGEVQTAYIKGRQIIDGHIIADDVTTWAKKYKKKLMFLKVDFEKDFDTLNMSFLCLLWNKKGFSNKWRKWILFCLKSGYALVLINGSQSSKFKVEQGLRQGDPLSPFLFVLAVEALNVVFLEAKNNNIFHGAIVGNDKVYILHLQFADDALIIGKWSLLNAKNLSRILTCFHHASGLKVNFNKSKLYSVGVNMADVNSLASTIGFLPPSFPCTYLGLPIGSKMTRCTN
ncbi:putative RNA-directed DNA polymerase, eukaryota, reverse transcriptase zinc-binding domain protein [Tanacetum coccineum]